MMIPFIFIFTIQCLFAGEVLVRNVRFEQQDTEIVVYYDLESNSSKKHEVTLILSDNSGLTFNITPRETEGDIGKNVLPGRRKKIIWHFMKDYPQGLKGDNFVFCVQAELEKGGSKLHWYLIGAGVIGGVVYFVTQSKDGGSDDPTTGSVTITIPGDI